MFSISTFASSGQSFSSSYLAPIFPIFPLALLLGALFIAVSLSCALNFEESPALSIRADANIARLKKFPPQCTIQ